MPVSKPAGKPSGAVIGNGPAVSIVLAVRNGAETICQAVQSVVWQSFTDWELIILDDGSDDATQERLTLFADPRIRLYADGLRLGLAARLNQGVDVARGEFVARMDADDIALPDRLLKQVTFLCDNPTVDVVGGQSFIVDQDLRLNGVRRLPSHPDEVIAGRFGPALLMHPTICGRRAWFLQHRYDARLLGSEDQELFIRAAPHSRYANLPAIILGYREGPLVIGKQWRNRSYLIRGLLQLASSQRALFTAIVPVAVVLAKSVVETVAIVAGLGRVLSRRRRIPATTDESQLWQVHMDRLERELRTTLKGGPADR